MAVNPAECRKRLSALARRDPFLNQADQRPLLDRLLTAIDSTIREALAQAERQLDETGRQLDDELEETAEQLRKAAVHLGDEFAAVLDNQPLTAETTSRLGRTIEGRILWLYDRVRVRLDASLNRIAPKGRLLHEILQLLSAAWEKPCRDLPEELMLIIDRQQQHQADGRSIWQIEGEHVLNQACEGHSYLGSWLTYLRLRQQLRRRFKIVRGELCEILRRHMPAPLQKVPPAALEQCQQTHEERISSFGDLWRNLRFNLESAAEDCSRLAMNLDGSEPLPDAHQRLEETSQLVRGTLERAAAQLATAATPLKQAWATLLADLDNDRGEILALIPRDLQRELSWQERARHNGRHLARLWKHWWTLGRKQLDRPWQVLANSLAKLPPLARRLLRLSGGVHSREETLQKLSDLPTPEEILTRAADLPPVCRRLFTIGALKNREFLVGKEEHLETLRTLFKRWQEGRLCSVAVVGPNGSGKTSLVNCFQSELGNHYPVHRLNVEQRLKGEQPLIDLCCRWFNLPSTPVNLAELEKQLQQLPPAVVIVENVHRLLLRTPGGLQSIRAFLRLVLASRKRLFWVATCRIHPWQRMLHLLQIDRYFTNQLPTLFGTQAEIRDAMMLRLQTSSYPVVFLREDGNGHALEKNGDDQNALQERYFADLFAASRGNMQAALYYWLLCLDYDQAKDRLTVRPLGKLDYSSLRSLDRQQLYTLAEIIAHGELTAEEHAAIFACDTLRSGMLLDHLVQLNLLGAAPQDDAASRYQLNPLFYAPATATLEGRNILQ